MIRVRRLFTKKPATVMTLRIITTGGTFDKHYNELTGQLELGNSVLPSVLERARLTLQVVVEPLFALDSLDMQDHHRHHIRKACIDSPEDNIVIVHGTDTLRETAEVVGNAVLTKTIVLVGAMIPYEIANSDALFNLGFAVAVAQCSPAGVYVAMNGQVFAWNDVKKNRSTGVFEQC